MFDIGFLEILVILIIGLLVIGPERMPEVARKLGSFIGRTRRFIESVKRDSEFQTAVNELKEAVDLEEQKKALTNLSQDLQTDLQQTAQAFEPIDLSDLERPFNAPETTEPSQFRKAPATPEPPQATNTTATTQLADKKQEAKQDPKQPPQKSTPSTESPLKTAPTATTEAQTTQIKPMATERT